MRAREPDADVARAVLVSLSMYWLDHYQDFVEFFFSQALTEPHSTKQHEDCVGRALAEATGGSLVVLQGGGHLPMARHPVKVNLLVREFAESLAPRRGS
jgi:hypothetical protein